MSDPDPMSEAIAAMRREWAEIRDRIFFKRDPEMLDEEREEAVKTATRLMKGFLERHHDALLAAGADPAQLDVARLEEVEQRFLKASGEVRAAEERLLQGSADAAEAGRELAVATLDILRSLEELSQEQWDAMDAGQRKNTWDLIEELRGAREGLLAALPIEERRKWEP